MGMSVNGVLVVGLPFYDLCVDSEDFYEHYENDFDRISPCYDADNDLCILGWCVARGYYEHAEVTEEALNSIPGLKEEFKKVTGKEAKLYVMPWVS